MSQLALGFPKDLNTALESRLQESEAHSASENNQSLFSGQAPAFEDLIMKGKGIQ